MLVVQNAEGSVKQTGGIQVYKKTFVTAGSIYLPRYTWLLGMIIHSNIAVDIKIGTAAGANDVLDAWPLTADSNTININMYFEQVTTLYFTAAAAANITVAYITTGVKLP
jgi:hypothetical protein